MERPALSRQDDNAWRRCQDQSPHQRVKTPFHPACVLDAKDEEANPNLGKAYDQKNQVLSHVVPLQALLHLLCAQVIRMASNTFMPLETVENQLDDEQDRGEEYSKIVPT